MKELDLDKYIFDPSVLAYLDRKSMRIHFLGKTKSHKLDAGPRTQLHIQSMSQVEIRTWNHPQIEVELPTRAYPFELYWAKNYVSLREKQTLLSKLEPARIIIRAPYQLGLMNLMLSGNATCANDNTASLLCVTTKNNARAEVTGHNIFAQSYDNTAIIATVVSDKNISINRPTPGNLFAINAGKGIAVYGSYRAVNVIFLNGSTLVNHAAGDTIFAYKYISSSMPDPRISLFPSDGKVPSVYPLPLEVDRPTLRNKVTSIIKGMVVDCTAPF